MDLLNGRFEQIYYNFLKPTTGNVCFAWRLGAQRAEGYGQSKCEVNMLENFLEHDVSCKIIQIIEAQQELKDAEPY